MMCSTRWWSGPALVLVALVLALLVGAAALWAPTEPARKLDGLYLPAAYVLPTDPAAHWHRPKQVFDVPPYPRPLPPPPPPPPEE